MAIEKEMLGVAPAMRDHLTLLHKALAGDIAWSVSPATVTGTSTSAAWTRTVNIKLVTAAGEVHEWFDKAIATGVAVTDDSTAGTASIPSTTLTVEKGCAAVVVSGDAAEWAGAETDTLTVAQATILGYTVAAKTSVETFA
jgi:hypothetical protein